MTSEFPTGIVTLVFTDLEGSSELSARHGARFEVIRDEHFRLLRECAQRWQGFEVETAGDSLFAVFASATDAVRFAVEVQCTFARHPWPSDIGALRVRIGAHSGEPFIGSEQGRPTYRGPATNRTARVMSAGHGGQIVLSQTTRDLVGEASLGPVTFQDLGLHRLKGVGEEHIWQVCYPELSDEFPPLQTLSPIRHNLPLPSAPFIGREAQLNDWLSLLRQPTTRLMTLLGFGGIGKTRAAQQLAEMSADDFKDGVWWMELENATNGDEMMQRIAEQLRLHLRPQPTLREQLWDFHRDRKLLLVLDNTEQVYDQEAAEVIHGLLEASPHIKCLVTSRRSLNLAAERVVELMPMPLDDAENLFIERARSRKTSFARTTHNAADISAICRTLEGMPLAVEIAASLIVLLAPRQILKKLEDELTILVTRDPSRPRRQQALRAAIDWSYELLTDEAQNLLAQLSVFAGGFSFETAEAVCESRDIMDELLELRSHSLLRSETDAATQQERLLMLESVRHYALERLISQGEDKVEATRRHHAQYFLSFVEERIELLHTADEAEALEELELEFNNLRGALQWATEHDAEICGRLALAFHQPLYMRGLWGEARQCLEKGWATVQGIGSDTGTLRAALGHHRAALAHDMGEHDTALAEAKDALEEFQRRGDTAGSANTLNLLALLATEDDDLERAQQLCEEALRAWPLSHHSGRGKTLHNLARLYNRQGKTEEANRCYEACLLQRQRAGDARGEAETLGNMGVLAQNRGDASAARRLYGQSLRLRQKLRDRHGIAIMLHNLGELAEIDGDFSHAIVLFIHAERIFRDVQSAFATIPSQALKGLGERLGEEQFAALREQAERATWEELV